MALSLRFTRWCRLAFLAAGGFAPVVAGQTLAPAEFPALRRAAAELLEARRFEPARDLFDRLARAEPDDGRLWLALGAAWEGLREWLPAVEAYRRALALGFGSRADQSYRIARLYARAGSADSALAWLERALAARYEERPSIADDSAFRSLADDPRFRRIALLPRGEAVGRDEGWRSDLAVFAAEAKRLATGPDPVALRPDFDSAVAALAARVPELTDERMYVELQRLMTMLGNGHSVLFPFPTERVRLTMLPVDLYRFGDGLYVIGGMGSAAALVGSRVERIGDLSPEEALERVAPLVTRDNPMGVVWNGPYFLTYPVIVHALGIDSSPDLDRVRLTVVDPHGRRTTVTETGGEIRPPGKLIAPTGGGARPPLYLRRPDDNYWLEALPGWSALYVQYNQVANGKAFSVAAFGDTILATARRLRLRNLIVDVRRNNGGNGSLNRPLVQALVRFEGWGPDHRIFVVTGRNTYSAAQNFINDVERITSALFAGEPSSSRPNFVGEDTEVLLPWSGLRGSIGSRYFQDSSPLDERLWIPPDIPVSLSSSDYFANRDPILDAVLAAIRSGRQGRASAARP